MPPRQVPRRVPALLSVAAALAFSAIGCVPTQYNAVAPAAKTGWVYVVGMRGPRSLILLCPTVPGASSCSEVEVTEE